MGQGIQDKLRMNHARAHHPDDPHIMRILHPGRTGKIGRGIGTPVTAEGYDFRLETHLEDSFTYLVVQLPNVSRPE
jgi:hypothetical protein